MASDDEETVKMELDTEDQSPEDPLDDQQTEYQLGPPEELEYQPLLPDPQSVPMIQHQPNVSTDQEQEEILIDDANNRKYKIFKEAKVYENTFDIQQKFSVANIIIQKLKTDFEDSIPIPQVDKLKYFTLQNKEYLENLLKNENVGRTLKQVMKDIEPIPATALFIQGDIRDIFLEFYIEKKELPTKLEFLEKLRNKREDIFYKNITYRQLVKNDLVKYNYIPKLNRVILTENPQFAYKRHLYLNEIINCRTRGKTFIYVSIIVLPHHPDVDSSFLALAASSTLGLIDSYLTKSNNLDNITHQVRLWLQSQLLPKIPLNAVVVLSQDQKNETDLTPFSTKADMMQWLKKQDIPFDSECQKAQLFNLIKTSKEKTMGIYDGVLSSAGLQVVNFPIEYEKLDFFKDIFANCVKSNKPEKNRRTLIDLMKKLSRDEWARIEGRVMEEERQMMMDDTEMDNIVCNLFEMVKAGEVGADDFPEGCFSTRADNYDAHIGDIIVD